MLELRRVKEREGLPPRHPLPSPRLLLPLLPPPPLP